MEIKTTELCRKCLAKIRKGHAEYMRQYREKKAKKAVK